MSKYAIIKTGGKQYRIEEGNSIDVELLKVDIGEEVEFKDILSFHNGDKVKFGKEASAIKVKGEVEGIVFGPKIHSVKYKRSHHQYRKFGHRQRYTRVKIKTIGQKEKEHGS